LPFGYGSYKLPVKCDWITNPAERGASILALQGLPQQQRK
jgi:hypothetical protein